MKRVRRIVFNAATVLSLVLLLAFYAGLLWHIRFGIAGAGRSWRVAMNEASLTIDCIKDDPPNDVTHFKRVCEVEKGSHFWRWGIVQGDHGYLRTGDWRGAYYSYNVALLPIIAVAGVLILTWLVNYWRALRRHALGGHCLSCGYDLRATPDRCPECGTVATTSKA